MIFKGLENAEAEVVYGKIDDENLKISCTLNTNAKRITEVYTEEADEKIRLLQDEFKIDQISQIRDRPVHIGRSFGFREVFHTEPYVTISLTVTTKWPLMKALAQLEELGIVAKTYTIKESHDYEHCHRIC